MKMASKTLVAFNNEDDLKNKEDLHIAGRHMVLDIFSFAVFLDLKTGLSVSFEGRQISWEQCSLFI